MIKQLLAIATQCPHGFGRLIFVEEHLYWGGLNRALGSLTLRRRRSTHQCRLYTNIQTAKIEHNSTFRSPPICRPVPVKIKWPNLLDTRWGDFKIGEIAGLDRSARWVVLERMQKGSRRSMLRKHANIPLEWNTSLTICNKCPQDSLSRERVYVVGHFETLDWWGSRTRSIPPLIWFRHGK